jgi:predicted metal-dependent HD superfamily phosphohydrolase
VTVADDDLELRIAWQRHLGRSPASIAWFDSVLGHYRSPGRHYHGVRHLRWVVRHVTELAAATHDLDAVIAAACFHDVVYDPIRSGNETASAQLADRALTELGWQRERRRHVAAMIEATISHDAGTTDGDTQVLLAADLAVLAAEPSRYGDYARAVRREYAHLSDDEWRIGRSAVLRGLLDRPRLFALALELGAWELRARANITAELAILGR